MSSVMLSFDIEEFDMPLEYGAGIPFQQQIDVSVAGTSIILDLLLKNKIRATFFSTVIFASNAPYLIERIIKEGHELASHGYYHSKFENSHLLESRQALETISGATIKGFRMARMMPVSDFAIKDAGYEYNSSLNPVYLPGRYNNFSRPRTLFEENNLIQLPASATPLVRIPLFWLSFHNFPLWFYKAACKQTISKDGYLNIYFHPWEFIDLTKAEYQLPGFVSRNSGSKMEDRFAKWIEWLKTKEVKFDTISDFLGKRTY